MTTSECGGLRRGRHRTIITLAVASLASVCDLGGYLVGMFILIGNVHRLLQCHVRFCGQQIIVAGCQDNAE